MEAKDGMASLTVETQESKARKWRAQGIFSKLSQVFGLWRGWILHTLSTCHGLPCTLKFCLIISLISFFSLISTGFPTCWKKPPFLNPFISSVHLFLFLFLFCFFSCRFTSILPFVGMLLHQTVIEFQPCTIVLVVKNGPIWSLTSGSLHSNWGDRHVNPPLKYIGLSVPEILYLRYQENLQNWFKKEEMTNELGFLKNE